MGDAILVASPRLIVMRIGHKFVEVCFLHELSRFCFNAQNFSLGPEAGSMDVRAKKICSFLFHPFLPLALSVQQTLFLPPSVVNIHFRRWRLQLVNLSLSLSREFSLNQECIFRSSQMYVVVSSAVSLYSVMNWLTAKMVY